MNSPNQLLDTLLMECIMRHSEAKDKAEEMFWGMLIRYLENTRK